MISGFNNKDSAGTWRGATLRRHAQGFSLIELLIALALVAILAAMALPSFSSTFNFYRVNGAAIELSNALQLARIEAIRIRAVVQVGQTSASTPGCSPAGSTDWHCGVDVGLPAGSTASLIKTIPASALAGVNVQFAGSGKQSAIQYNSLGVFSSTGMVGSMIYLWPAVPATGTAASSPFTATLCIGAGGKVRVIPSYVTATTTPGCP